MKELVATAHNLFYARNNDGTFAASIELILVASEPVYTAQVEDGAVKKLGQRRETETFRVVCSPGALGLLLKTAVEATEEIERQSQQPAEGESLDDALKRIYERYGNDLPAFFRDAYAEYQKGKSS